MMDDYYIESGHCCFSFERYSKCVTQIYSALYGGAIFVPLEGAQNHGGRKVTETYFIVFCYQNEKSTALEHQHIETDASSESAV